MKEFTADSRLFSVKHCKQFKQFKKYILAPRRYSSFMTVYKIKNLSWFYNINAEETAHTLNVMRQGIDGGSISYIPLSHKDAAIYPFIIGKNKPFVLVLAGGGYNDVCSIIEGFPVAVKLNKMGYNAFVGQYRVGKQAKYPNSLDDVTKMLQYIFKNAGKMQVSAENYAVCGFSAGGHLAACFGTKALGYAKYGLPKPAAMILSYPVITMDEYTHKGSRKLLLREGANNGELKKLYSVECQVDGDYPPTFIWHCKSDKVVPFKNSLLMTDALAENNVRYEFMPIEGTAHGLGIATGTAAEGWLDKAVAFWQNKENSK